MMRVGGGMVYRNQRVMQIKNVEVCAEDEEEEAATEG